MAAKKSLADDFASTPPTARRVVDVCNVGRAIKEHSEGAVIARTVDDLRWSAASIVRVLAKHDIVVSQTAIRTHRRRECSCTKAAK